MTIVTRLLFSSKVCLLLLGASFLVRNLIKFGKFVEFVSETAQLPINNDKLIEAGQKSSPHGLR